MNDSKLNNKTPNIKSKPKDNKENKMKEKTHTPNININVSPRTYLKRGEGKSVVNANV